MSTNTIIIINNTTTTDNIQAHRFYRTFTMLTISTAAQHVCPKAFIMIALLILHLIH